MHSVSKVPQELRENLKEELDHLTEEEITKKVELTVGCTTSPEWGNLIKNDCLNVLKANKKQRICLELNEAIMHEHYALCDPGRVTHINHANSGMIIMSQTNSIVCL